MGGRGTYSLGQSPAYTYKTVGMIGDTKILIPIDQTKALKLPEESHTRESKCVLFDKEGVFHQYREYNNDHKAVLEIGYHLERSLGTGNILHIHVHGEPGVDNHNHQTTVKRRLTRAEYLKYRKLFKGVLLDEGKYFN